MLGHGRTCRDKLLSGRRRPRPHERVLSTSGRPHQHVGAGRRTRDGGNVEGPRLVFFPGRRLPGISGPATGSPGAWSRSGSRYGLFTPGTPGWPWPQSRSSGSQWRSPEGPDRDAAGDPGGVPDRPRRGSACHPTCGATRDQRCRRDEQRAALLAFDGGAAAQRPPCRGQMRAAQPASSIRTGSESGRPAPPPGSRPPSAAQCDTRSTAAVPATGR